MLRCPSPPSMCWFVLICLVLLKQAGTRDPTWTTLSSDKIKRSDDELKITVCAHSWSKLYPTRHQETQNPTATFKGPGKKQGMGSKHRVLCMPPALSTKVKVASESAISWTIYSLPDSPVYGLLQARILEWVAVPFSRGSSQPRDWTQVSCTAGKFLTIWATRETKPTPKRWANHLSHPSCPIPGHISFGVRNQLVSPCRASRGPCYLFLLSAAAAGTPIKPCLNVLSVLLSISIDWEGQEPWSVSLPYFLTLQDAPSSSYISPTPVLESDTSPRGPNAFYWRAVLENGDLGTGGLLPLRCHSF